MKKADYSILFVIVFLGCSVLFTYTFFVEGRLPYLWGIEVRTNEYDLHNFSKSLSMIVLSLTVFPILVIGTIRKAMDKNVLFAGLICFFIFLFSYFQSEESIREVTLLGLVNRNEGLLAWIAYLIFFIFVLSFINSKAKIVNVAKYLGFIFFICAMIGFGQHFGFDLLKTTFYRGLMSFVFDWEYTLKLMPINFGNSIYSTLANPNNVSFLFSILLSAITYWLLVERKEKFHHYLLWGLFFFCLVGSNSTGGLLGYAITAIVALPFLWNVITKEYRRFWRIVFVATLCIIPNIPSIIAGILPIPSVSDPNAINGLTNVTRTENGVMFETTDQEVLLTYDSIHSELLFSSNNQPIDYYNKGGIISLEYPYNDYVFFIFDDGTFGYRYRNNYVKIAFHEGDYYVVNPYGMLVSTWDVATSSLIKNESFGTGRGYIWSRSLPLLKETLFIGKGADSFVYYFPQEDILGKSTGLYEGPYAIVDKPHSAYIQIAFSFGVLFAIIFFGIFMVYVVYAMKLTRISQPTTVENYIIGIGFSMIAFLVSALFYDLSVHVTPTVILMLGIGIVLLRLRREEQKAKLIESETVVVELES